MGNENVQETLEGRFDLKEFMKKNGLIIIFLIIFAVFSATEHNFLSTGNIIAVLRANSVYGLIACAMTFVLITGNFDLSVGSIVSAGAVFACIFYEAYGATVAVLGTLAIGAVIGLINGYLVGYQKLNSFIVTLAMMTVVQASVLIYVKGAFFTFSEGSDWFSYLGLGYIGSLPFSVVLFIIVAIISGFVLAKTTYGRKVYAVGGSSIVSKYTGIKDSKTICTAYIFSALMAMMGGIILASRLSGAQNATGAGYELDVIAAVILGGTSLKGGSGTVARTVIGVLLLGFVKNGLLMAGFKYYWQWIVIWIVIIAAVAFEVAAKKGAKGL